MIEPRTNWHEFRSPDEQLQYLKDHQLLSRTATESKPLYYRGFYSSDLLQCQVVGCLDQTMAVIRIGESLHCIHPDLLKDMQPTRAELVAQEPPAEPSAQESVPDSAPECLFDLMDKPTHGGQVLLKSVADYTVIDLETTGLSCCDEEIIELAALRVRGGQAAESFQSLVQCRRCLSSLITGITGICAEDLKDAPFIEDILPAYLDFLGQDILVGHNVTFDADFLANACARHLGCSFDNDLIDTLRLSRKRLTLPSYKLTDVRIALNLPERNAHRALDDCETTMDVYEALKKLAPKPEKKKQSNASGSRNRNWFRAAPLERHPEMYPSEIVTGEDSPFFGAVCVLTGELHISREEAADMITAAGGTVKSAVSGKTRYLIVGQQDKALVGEDGLSSKEEKAIALNKSGKGNIQMLSEAQFIAMLSKEGVPCG